VLSLDQALAELPDTAEGIAALLAEQNARGKRCDVQIRDENGWRYESPETPSALRDFVERFDDGEWPELAVADVD